MSVSCRIFQSMCGSKRLRQKRQFAAGRSRALAGSEELTAKRLLSERHHPDFCFQFGRIHYRAGIPRAAIEEASIRSFAVALLAADAQDRVNLNGATRGIVFIR